MLRGGEACGLLIFGVVLAGFLLLFLASRPRPANEAAIVARLRAALTACPSLAQGHPEVAEVLRAWPVEPLKRGISHTRHDDQRIRLVVLDRRGEPYDDATLTHALLHEALHAARGEGTPEQAHDAAFMQQLDALLAAAARDGAVDPLVQPDTLYPAHIL